MICSAAETFRRHGNLAARVHLRVRLGANVLRPKMNSFENVLLSLRRAGFVLLQRTASANREGERGGPLSLRIDTNTRRGADKRFSQHKEHGWGLFNQSWRDFRRKLLVWPNIFYNTPPKYPISIPHKSVFSHYFMFPIFCPSFSLNQIHFLRSTTVFQRTTRTDASQVPPDAPEQWLHSWQISPPPRLKNLIGHWTAALSVLSV